MRAILLGAFVLAVPFPAAAAVDWCPVSSAEAATHMDGILPRLKSRLNSQPAPMVHIHTEGTLPHQGIRDESIAAKGQLPIMQSAAFAWRAGAGDAYFDLAERYLNAWITTYQPNLNPIDETNFDAMIDTYAIIASKMDPAARATADAYFRNWAKGYVAAIDAHTVVSASPQASTWNNNWQSHRIKLVTMIAVALDDPELFADARRLFQAQVAANIQADGEVRDFAERDAMHYVIYDLEPLTQAAMAARLRGEDWYHYQSPEGASIAKGMAWLYPYANGDKPHEEFTHSKVAFDAQRAAAGEQGYSGPFDPTTAGGLFWAASLFEPDYRNMAQRLRPEAPVYITVCGN